MDLHCSPEQTVYKWQNTQIAVIAFINHFQLCMRFRSSH